MRVKSQNLYGFFQFMILFLFLLPFFPLVDRVVRSSALYIKPVKQQQKTTVMMISTTRKGNHRQ
jgi:hypothetical protein